MADEDFYYVRELDDRGPRDAYWNFQPRKRPSPEELQDYLKSLSSRWPEIVGAELARVTRPESFAGRKARRLVVIADADVSPTWGSWSWLSVDESKRREFTRFRSSVNAAIAPHEVDHIDFVTKREAGGFQELPVVDIELV